MSPSELNKDDKQRKLMHLLKETDEVPLLHGLPHTESSIVRHDENVELPKLHIMNRYHFELYGVDAIWHNMYRGDDNVWTVYRGSYDATIEQMVQMVAGHIAKGYYTIVSLNASKHNLTVVCACEKVLDFGTEDWRDPANST